MNHKDKRIQLVKTIEEAKKELALEDSRQHYESLKNDIALGEERDKLNDALDKDDFSEVSKSALNIHHRIISKSILDMENNIVQEIKDLKNTGNPQSLPPGFGLKAEIIRGKYIMMGALPKVGKTTAACNLARYNSFIEKKTLFLSSEMTPLEIWIKIFLIDLFIETKNSLAFIPTYTAIRARGDEGQKKLYALFLQYVEKNVANICVLDSKDYTPMLMGIAMDNSYNYFGRLGDWVISDFVQIIKAEPTVTGDFRERQNYALRYLAHKIKDTSWNLLAVSQMNKDGGYKESSEWEANSSMNLVLHKIMDGDEELDKIRINVKSSRFTSAPSAVVKFDKKSGFIG